LTSGDTQGVPESNIELTRQGFRVFNEGGPEAFLEYLSAEDLLHPEFVFYIQEDMPNGGEWRGADGFREMSRHWLEAWKEFSIRPVEVTESPDGHVMMEVEQRAVARGSGMEISGRGFFYVAVYRDGKIAEMHLTNDRGRAARLAALEA
jgi:ketosteroid isomerase-like protein